MCRRFDPGSAHYKLDHFYGFAAFASPLAAVNTSFAASALSIAIPNPTTKSGQADLRRAVISPAAMIATFAKASFLADRNAARVRLPECARYFVSINAHERLMISAPPPASDSGKGDGGTGCTN